MANSLQPEIALSIENRKNSWRTQPIMAYGEAPPEMGNFFRLRYTVAEVYEREGKSMIINYLRGTKNKMFRKTRLIDIPFQFIFKRLHENEKWTSRLSDLCYVCMLTRYHYTKRGTFLSKMVYKRVRGWTSRRSFPV